MERKFSTLKGKKESYEECLHGKIPDKPLNFHLDSRVKTFMHVPVCMHLHMCVCTHKCVRPRACAHRERFGHKYPSVP